MAASIPLKISVEPPIGWLTVDRPASRGAMNREMWTALPGLLEELTGNDGVRVVVIRGSEGNFIAGADITEFERLRSDPARARDYDQGANTALEVLEQLSVPSVAMVGGPAVGGGCLVAFGCDLRIIADEAYMSIPAGKLGLAYPYAALERLVEVAGEGVAMELTLTGRRAGGKECLALGLVQRSVPQAELEATTRGLAAEIASNAPLSLAYLRRAIRRRSPAVMAPETAKEMAAACFASEDYREGVTAFLEKRRPRFRGR